mmetsp:Transcript_23914/g.74445  ORF Transcript_23914/g.74445 Transcript_23914/m.74445 type:complete len:266 (-) Transcript_23914:480-1277(-)
MRVWHPTRPPSTAKRRTRQKPCARQRASRRTSGGSSQPSSAPWALSPQRRRTARQQSHMRRHRSITWSVRRPWRRKRLRRAPRTRASASHSAQPLIPPRRRRGRHALPTSGAPQRPRRALSGSARPLSWRPQTCSPACGPRQPWSAASTTCAFPSHWTPSPNPQPRPQRPSPPSPALSRRSTCRPPSWSVKWPRRPPPTPPSRGSTPPPGASLQTRATWGVWSGGVWSSSPRTCSAISHCPCRGHPRCPICRRRGCRASLRRRPA